MICALTYPGSSFSTRTESFDALASCDAIWNGLETEAPNTDVLAAKRSHRTQCPRCEDL